MEDIVKKVDMKLVVIGMGLLVVHLVMATVFMMYNGNERTAHEGAIAALKSDWKNEDLDRTIEHEKMMQEQFGADKLSRITVDPRLGIEKTLLKLFEAVVPSEYTVEVKVDRFTEFQVVVNTFNMPKPDILAGYLKKVFSRFDDDYVYEVIFTDGENVWIIDRKQLQKVNWKSGRDSQILRYCFPSK